jgi:hypothetical protein
VPPVFNFRVYIDAAAQVGFVSFQRCETSAHPVFGLLRGSAAAEGIRATREVCLD